MSGMSDKTPQRLRLDPLPFLRTWSTAAGIALRRGALDDVQPGDWDLGNTLLNQRLAQQEAAGSWGGSLEATGEALLELVDLDVVANHPAVELAAEWTLDRLAPVTEGTVPFLPEQWPALLALCCFGRNYESPVQRVLTQLLLEPHDWLAAETPACAVSQATRLLLADPEARTAAVVEQATLALRDRACCESASAEDRWAFLDLAAHTESTAAATGIEPLLPFIVATQNETSHWAAHTATVVRALCQHGWWERVVVADSPAVEAGPDNGSQPLDLP